PVAAALVDARGAADGDRRGDVVDGDAGGVLGDPAILVPDLALDRADTVVGRRAGGAAGRAESAVAGAAVEGVLEAGRGVGQGRVERADQRQVERAALVDRASVAEGRRGRDVVDGDVGAVRARTEVLVADLALDLDGAVVGRRAGTSVGAAPGRPGRAVIAAEPVLEAGGGVGQGRVELASQRQVDRKSVVDRAVVAERGRGRDVVDGDGRRVAAEAVVLVEDAALDDLAWRLVFEGAGCASVSV